MYPQSLWKFANSFFIPWAASPSEQTVDVEATMQASLHEAEPESMLETGCELAMQQSNKADPPPSRASATSPAPRSGHKETAGDVSDEDDIDTSDLLEDIQLEDQPEDELEAHKDKGLESDEEGEGDVQSNAKNTRKPPPSVMVAREAYKMLKDIISPPRNKGKGYKDANLDLLTRSRLEAMKCFLWIYIDPESRFYDQWMAASLNTTQAAE